MYLDKKWRIWSVAGNLSRQQPTPTKPSSSSVKRKLYTEDNSRASMDN